MSETKFTKGSWSEIPQHAAGPMIAKVIETGQQMTPTRLRLIAHVLERGDSIKEDRANAHLIAAAPSMYAELEALVTVNENWNTSVSNVIHRPPNWNDSYLDKARAALAKARGEQR